VGLGAFGAHGLKARVTDVYYLDIWNTAAQYQMYHALAMAAAPIVVTALRRHRSRTGLSVWQGFVANFKGKTVPTRAAASAPSSSPPKFVNWSARFFLLGTVFFSGSLYALTLTENKKWGAVAPIGGVGFVLGWCVMQGRRERGEDAA
jgi:uncharacterized membrane protein YgdD (TMEM256/DUF423 family)